MIVNESAAVDVHQIGFNRVNVMKTYAGHNSLTKDKETNNEHEQNL